MEATLRSLSRVLMLLALVLAISNPVLAQIPRTINHQGHLVDEKGDPISGFVIVKFRLYEAESSGSPVWTEDHGVQVSDGVFEAALGSVEPFDAVSFNKPLWLGIVVNHGAEMSPRLALTSVPYSFRAATIQESALEAGNNISIERAGDAVKITAASLGTGDGYSLDARDGNPTDALYVDGQGDVGIGTQLPTSKLNIVDDTDMPSNPTVLSNTAFKVLNPTAPASAMLFDANQIESVGSSLFLNARSPGGTGNDVILADGGGNVGIGTGDPLETLHVASSASTRLKLQSLVVQSPEGVYQDTTAVLLTFGDSEAGIRLEPFEIGPNGHFGPFPLPRLRIFASHHTVGVTIGSEEDDVVDIGPSLAENAGSQIHISAANGFANIRLNKLAPGGDWTPAIRLRVNGYDGTGQIIADNITAGVKNFRVANPLEPGTDIVYASLEGPEAAAYVRGTATLVDGWASIPLPDHFTSVANEDGLTVHLTPLSALSKGLAVTEKNPRRIVVEELFGGHGSYDLDYYVVAVRKGFEDYRVIRPSEDDLP